MPVTSEQVLGLALAVAATNSWAHLRLPNAAMYDMRARSIADVQNAGPRANLVFLVTLCGSAGFSLGLGRPVMGVLVFGGLLALRRWEVRTWPGDTVIRLGKYAPAGAMLLGWECAWGFAWALGRPEAAEAWGRSAGAGVLGACYALAAASKVKKSGWNWAAAPQMQLLVAERAGPETPARRLRAWLARRPAICAAVGQMGLLLEAAGPGLVVPPLRPLLALSLFLFHVLTWLLFGYLEPEWALAVIAAGLA